VILLRPVLATDAAPLYPQLAGTRIPDTILWDGPDSLADYQAGLASRADQVTRGEVHVFTILGDGAPVGMIDVRPKNDFRGDLGLWVGEAHHGRGVGTEAVRLAAHYAFDRLGLKKLEATVFIGNTASRRIFEKNHFTLEGTIRRAVRKRGQLVDEWLFGLLPEELRES
jgi:RimJ/RimL family protein N-acetyltransferase